MKLKVFIIPACLLGLFVSGCNHKKDKPVVAPPVKVKVLTVGESGNVAESMSYSGTVSSAETTTVSFSVAGTITDLYAKEGDKVTKGKLLGKVRNGEYLNAYNIAEAQLAEAQDGYNRLKKLHDANALPEVKWVEMEQKLKQAQNAAEMAKRTLSDASLYSPASGTVTKKYADVGQTVMPVEPVYEIVSTSNITIDISVSENEIGKFKTGDPATVSIDSKTGTITGKISSKSVTADPLTRSYTVKVAIPNPEGDILPGMLGHVSFQNKETLEKAFQGVILPSGSVLLNNDNRWFVWVVNDSVAQRRFVIADQLVADGVLITSGLQPGDKVIVEGTVKVGSGTKVSYQ